MFETRSGWGNTACLFNIRQNKVTQHGVFFDVRYESGLPVKQDGNETHSLQEFKSYGKGFYLSNA